MEDRRGCWNSVMLLAPAISMSTPALAASFSWTGDLRGLFQPMILPCLPTGVRALLLTPSFSAIINSGADGLVQKSVFCVSGQSTLGEGALHVSCALSPGVTGTQQPQQQCQDLQPSKCISEKEKHRFFCIPVEYCWHKNIVPMGLEMSLRP